MNNKRYEQYLREIVTEAATHSDGTVSGIADYLLAKKKPGRFSKAEEKLAFERVRKNFAAYRDRQLWFVLKCMGIKPEELENV